jgi:hypothetical protein
MISAERSAWPQTQEPAAMVRNGLPGEMHKRLDALVGEWDVEKSFYRILGTPERPLISKGLLCRRSWVAETGNRHMQDVTQGILSGGAPCYRHGILSYWTMDKRYEWNTVDGLNSMMMTYKGKPGSGRPSGDIVMTGQFTDQGMLGAAYIGKTIAQRTVIKIEPCDRHVIEMYFTPPGEKERLIDRSIYTRRQ